MLTRPYFGRPIKTMTRRTYKKKKKIKILQLRSFIYIYIYKKS